MRRSSSTSHIPIVRGDSRARSKSSARTSIKDSTKKTRAGSTDRLPKSSLQRPTSSSNFTPNLLGVKSYGAKKSSLVTPTGSLFKRSNSNLATPCSSVRSRSRSPYKLGLEQAILDKEWVSKQSSKVVAFLERHPNAPEYIREKLKPPITINTFVSVMHILLKEIHPRIEEINNVNYKDIVFKMLKLFRYPGNVSNSLLKTVNTKHAWPQVVCILSWLVDVITTISRVDSPPNPSLEDDSKDKKIHCFIDYIMRKYTLYNNNDEDQGAADAEFKEEYAKILNIDEDEFKKFEDDVSSLTQLIETQRNQKAEQQARNDSLKNEIDALRNETDAFYLHREEKQEQLDCKLTEAKTRREKLKPLIKERRENIEVLNETIKTQPCSIEEKKRMLNHIEELKHTISLKKEKARIQKCLKEEYDVKLAEAKKEVETEVYRINNTLFKLILLDPDLKILRLKETDFLSKEFEDNIENLIKNMKIFESKYAKELAQTSSEISKIDSKNSVLDAQREEMKKTINSLSNTELTLQKEIDLCKNNMEQMCKKREEDRKKLAETLMSLKKQESVLSHFQEKFKEVTDLRDSKAHALEVKKESYLKFFVELRKMTISYVGDLAEIRNQIFDKLKQSLVDIHQHQENILSDLHELDEVLENKHE